MLEQFWNNLGWPMFKWRLDTFATFAQSCSDQTQDRQPTLEQHSFVTFNISGDVAGSRTAKRINLNHILRNGQRILFLKLDLIHLDSLAIYIGHLAIKLTKSFQARVWNGSKIWVHSVSYLKTDLEGGSNISLAYVWLIIYSRMHENRFSDKYQRQTKQKWHGKPYHVH